MSEVSGTDWRENDRNRMFAVVSLSFQGGTMRAPPGLASGLFAGRYAIERLLGEGATATVHLARDTQCGLAVAIKLLRPELVESAATTRFLREIRRTSRLQHSHILPVLDSGEYEGQPYFVLPYMEGGTLRLRLKREHQMELNETIAIVQTISEALDYAHAHGLIHCDVKPENILFTSGQAVLGDFGIARALEMLSGESATSSSGVIRGTPAYMSPEQAAGSKDCDGRSDIYSLGCVLYEMITGMPAFIGPTPQSVIAQRFAYPPREVRVYRPTAPSMIDTILAKAFALTPSDRYRTAGEMVDAIRSAVTTPPSHPIAEQPKTALGLPLPSKQRQAIIVSALGIAIAAIVTLVAPQIPRRGEASVQADTTRLVLLPLERDGPSAPPWRDDDLLQQGLARWRGVAVVDQFQVADVLRRSGTVRTSGDAAAIAASLGAGRYIRGTVTSLGNNWRVSASLYDASRGQPLYNAAENVPTNLGGATAAYARLADSLLLQGAAADSLPTSATGIRSLPATQAFSRAQLALDDWDLAQADSGFQSAANFDPQYARASLWLAQVRAWQNQPRNTWGTVAERAAAMLDQLNERERYLVRALVELGRGSYRTACTMYDSLVMRNDRDFAAWFGRGQCRMLDKIVVPDVSSPSSWRFRSSTHSAMQAYAKAFEILPSVHRGFERGAFDRLRVLLLVTRQVVNGYRAGDSALFQARPGWIGDTLVLVPYPWQEVAQGGRETIPPGFDTAIQRRRAEFRRIAARWSAAFPQSSGAKQAVAISLELIGDAAAIDSLRAARMLTTDPARRLQLASSEVLLRIKFGVPDDLRILHAAQALADSLLRAPGSRSPDNARALAPIAALSGRCALADSLVREAQVSPGDRILPSLYVRSQSLTLQFALGCPLIRPGLALREFANAITRGYAPNGRAEQERATGQLLFRPAILAPSFDERVLSNLEFTRNQVISAALFAARNDRPRARAALEADDSVTVGPRTSDLSLARARIWATIGDTGRAIRELDAMFADLRDLDPGLLHEVGRAAAVASALALRADLANARGEAADRRRWGSAAALFWSRSDPSVGAVGRRMSQHASAH